MNSTTLCLAVRKLGNVVKNGFVVPVARLCMWRRDVCRSDGGRGGRGGRRQTFTYTMFPCVIDL